MNFFATAAALLLATAAAAQTASTAPLTADDAAKIAVAENPQVRAARARYDSALHQIDQAYAPQDPVATWTQDNSPRGLNHPASQTLAISESFQFPGKAWLQGDEAHRSAEIAKLGYEAAVRDAGAAAQTAYYQTLLDAALLDTGAENMESLSRVLKVAQVAYAANQVAQSDLISAEFDLASASQTFNTTRVAVDNDDAALNLALGRDPLAPLSLAPNLDLQPLRVELDALVAEGLRSRQEILEAALTEKNAKTALSLARLEFAPDFAVGYAQNRYLNGQAPPEAGVSKDNSISLGINVPIFFWWHQRQDAAGAQSQLDAARADRRGAELQAEASIVQIYRSTKLAYETAVLYRDSLIPLARQDFQVALIAYQSRKVDFPTLAGTLQRIYTARISYLTAANQFLAGRVALQQAIGKPLPL